MSPNERRIRRWQRECERQGHHIPWVKVGSFSSDGVQHRIRGLDDGVVSHLHSNGEEALYTRFAFYGGYRRLRAQVPLFPIEEVRNIAKSIGAKMPWDSDHGDWAVLSTDIVLDRIENRRLITEAFWVKPLSQTLGARKKSVENNVLIEEAVWRFRGGTLHPVISDTLDPVETRNIGRLYDELNVRPSNATYEDKCRYGEAFMRAWHRDLMLENILVRVERKLKLSPESGWNLFAATIQARLLNIDLCEELSEDLPVYVLR